MSEKQKKPIYKRKWFIALAVFFGLAFIGALMGEPEATEPTNPETTETTQADTTPAPEIDLQAYETDVALAFEKHGQDFDNIRANTQATIENLANTGDIYAAYDGLTSSAGAMEALRQRVDDMTAPDYLTKDQKDQYDKAKTAISNAAGYSRMAYNDLAKDIDKGDLSPSRIANYEQWTGMVEQEILSYAVAIAGLNADVGYGTEE